MAAMLNRMRIKEQQQPELADVFCKYGKQYIESCSIPLAHYKIMNDIVVCRTASLGGHIEVCDSCGKTQNSYNSCRNRHCPKCQSLTKARWLEARQAELLPVPYFHNVFTLPHELNQIILWNKKVTLDILFNAVSATLREFAHNPKSRYKEGGKIGFTEILHTWDQKLREHFHLHCVIPAGYLSHDGERWIHSKKKYLFPVKALSRVFRGKFIERLEIAAHNNELIYPDEIKTIDIDEGFRRLKKLLRSKEWVVYSKQPFGGPEQVLEYLGRYTHRVAISNNRILNMENNTVTFSYNDRKLNEKKSMVLSADEFIRRFLLHSLPKKFMRIRHFGFLANRCKKNSIRKCREILGQNKYPEEKLPKSTKELMLELTGLNISQCPFCKKGDLRKSLKIKKRTGPGFFERLRLTSLIDTS